MKTICVVPLIWFLCLSTAGAASWSDSIAEAMIRGDRDSERKLLQRHHPDYRVPVVFLEASKALQVQEGGFIHLPFFMRTFERPLARGLNSDSYQAYAMALADTSAPEIARAALLKIISLTRRKLEPNRDEKLTHTLKGLLGEPTETSVQLRTEVLRALGGLKSAESDSLLLSAASSPDSLFRSAAFTGLARKAVAYRHSNNHDGSAALLTKIQNLKSSDNPQIRSAAQNLLVHFASSSTQGEQ